MFRRQFAGRQANVLVWSRLSMQFKLQWKVLGWLIALAVVCVCLGRWYYTDAQNHVELQPHGKAALFRAGFFHREKCDLIVWHGKWRWSSATGYNGGELPVPFECPYNEHRTLRLEDHGKAYMVDMSELRREELRIVDGEWSFDAGDHWQSIFDLVE